MLKSACWLGAPEFQSHKSEFIRLDQLMARMEEEAGIVAVLRDEGEIRFRTKTDEIISLEGAKAGAGKDIEDLVRETSALAEELVILAERFEDGTFVCITWSAGFTGGGGYARVGSDGIATLERLHFRPIVPIAGTSEWFEVTT
jgi:hypothetical protein